MADVNVALGLVCKHYLERIVEGQSTAEALVSTEMAFPTCISVKSDLQKGFRFWDQLLEAVQSLSKTQSINTTTFEMFHGANAWLQKNKF